MESSRNKGTTLKYRILKVVCWPFSVTIRSVLAKLNASVGQWVNWKGSIYVVLDSLDVSRKAPIRGWDDSWGFICYHQQLSLYIYVSRQLSDFFYDDTTIQCIITGVMISDKWRDIYTYSL
jgi:hypothetical protein